MDCRAGFAMDYHFLMIAAQAVGLCLLGGSAIALLRLLAIHFVQRDWTAEQGRSLLTLTALQASGLLVFAFSGGGHLAIQFFRTSNLPPLQIFSVQVVLMLVLSASVVFLHVIARPWLSEEIEDTSSPDGRPLVMNLGVHRLLAMTLAFAAFASAWSLWLVTTLPGATPAASQVFAALALMTLLLWSLLAAPTVILRAAALYALRDEQTAVASVRHAAPLISDIPEHRIAHIPARRAPRPSLEPQEDYFNARVSD